MANELFRGCTFLAGIGVRHLTPGPLSYQKSKQLKSAPSAMHGGTDYSADLTMGGVSYATANAFPSPLSLVTTTTVIASIMAKKIKHTGLSLHFAEAFPCRLERIKTEWSKCIKNHEPDTVLQLAVLLSRVEQVLGIEYPSDIPSPTVTKPTCVVCRRSYTRVNGLDSHIKHTHPYLRPIIEATTCSCCQTEYNTHKQLVSHEKSIHKAVYGSRVEFTWPGFIQLDSKEGE
jgi:hypothetical protein